jgi:tetratricopeptide (TPR) repeat protein
MRRGESTVPDENPSPERVRVALEELLGWQGIARSPQLAELLRYVVERTLNGEGAGIKAYSIAVDVFGRPQDFDPQSDPIVRVQARRLRTLLEQFYAGGSVQSDVHIHLPLGRYVPEFRVVAKPEPPSRKTTGKSTVAATPDVALKRESERQPSRFLVNAILGLVFTLVGVGLTIGVIRWVLPLQSSATTIPDVPRITIGAFDNLTGEAVLDDDVREVGVRVGNSLRRFEDLVVGDGGLILTGTVQDASGQFILRAMLTDTVTNSAVWSSSIMAPLDVMDTEALTTAGNVLAAQLGHSGGPLHAQARAWLELQTALPNEPTGYVCYLLYMKWRDVRTVIDAERAAACFDKVIVGSPDDAMAIAAAAGMKAWRTQFLATPAEDLSALMADETAAAGRAVSLRPESSFVYEQQAVVLARQGSVDAAIGSITKAYELNPDSMDVVSVMALLYWIDGQFADAVRYSEESITSLPTAPSRYYTVRAFNALKEQRYFDAIDAAQALASGDEEFGPVVALAAAPHAARQDLIDRYRPMVMSNPHYQVAGILPRLAMRIRADIVFEHLREGLILAGVPPRALDGPFSSDGSPQNAP